MSPQPPLFHGPFLPNLVKAAAGGGALGSVAGFFVGALASAVRPVNLLKCAGYGAGLLGNFAAWIMLWSRIWT
jgi:hypothetical protein